MLRWLEHKKRALDWKQGEFLILIMGNKKIPPNIIQVIPCVPPAMIRLES